MSDISNRGKVPFAISEARLPVWANHFLGYILAGLSPCLVDSDGRTSCRTLLWPSTPTAQQGSFCSGFPSCWVGILAPAGSPHLLPSSFLLYVSFTSFKSLHVPPAWAPVHLYGRVSKDLGLTSNSRTVVASRGESRQLSASNPRYLSNCRMCAA